ncbi:MAG: hypothetical protein M1830_002050 [Pleopsidium flavum]|nr:MAG: hypothetical protein M1830_002050 [Pleopsidium flavum]
MDDPDSTYAPQSPDLSGCNSSYPPPTFQLPHQQFQTSFSQHSNYDPSPIFNSQHPQQPQNYSYPANNTMAGNGRMKHQDEDEDWMPESSTRASVRKPKRLKTEDVGLAPGVAEGIEVKTKFPVARIKRIMQADEDVGKVAQVTPVAVSKALELFMISLVTKAASEARSRSSKRVTAAHLKQAVAKDEVLDFLAEIIAKIPDAPAPSEKAEGSDVVEGKKRRGGARKKRKDSEDF